MNPTDRAGYLKTQLLINAGINSVLNGIIAYSSFSPRDAIPALEVAIDMEITLFIIGFLVAWLAVLGARAKFKGSPPQTARLGGFQLPKSASLRALLLMLGLMVVLGGAIILVVYLLSPGGVSNWAYIVMKTLYTGAGAALAAWAAIRSVFNEPNKGI
jgi:hypothetical protein